ncbi:class I SAM-dependent methyltransferase [Limnohabitans sp.]|uniref:class I SAM-dependent methyltransferase n=1 Tax=Limnohabitans sp. TaxID=1907725 RepID=UPI0038B89264
MRDPQAWLEFDSDFVLRHLNDPLPNEHVLITGVAQNWVQNNFLLPFEWLNADTLRSPRLRFITNPDEWSNAQLYDAAVLTLNMLSLANNNNADLKDASAWNIVYKGCRPYFCDHTSFQMLKYKTWWAGGQFVRHFISPLWLASETGLNSNDLFKISRDGADPELVKSTLGLRRFLSRCWPLLLSSTSESIAAAFEYKNDSQTNINIYRGQLLSSLKWMINGVSPDKSSKTRWASYTKIRQHYTLNSLEFKRQKVAHWLRSSQPKWTLDLGCNSGEFTELAANEGSQVIAIDGDHDAIQMLYKKFSDSETIHPVLASLDDIHSGRGWAGNEHAGLYKRLGGLSDVVMMLALIHHLGITSSIPLKQIANLANHCTKKWLIVELFDVVDSQLVWLCTQHQRSVNDFSISKQREAFLEMGFKLVEEVKIPDSFRSLVLFEKIVIAD